MNSDYKGRKKWIGLSNAFNGVKAAFQEERNLRIHGVIGFTAIILGLILRISPLEWTALILTIALVITLEMINSSIERVMNYLAPEVHPLIGAIKDIAAGAVLIAAISSIIIGFIIFIPKIMVMF
ncbi:diacylglycerol kinase family protein [Halobacillus sp. A5]|uniref:diacylglycerol kinase family protein n=1 Tax=Halobacillus sp. A5 TaxID=2880263 RepID=UPI0020A69BA7|nr:diacylglycerol kinase family protein [Halobacillus sp. A5]MCP3025643.1 diacylglycerol kinase family protein [Halobacillus sp. A5]